MSIFIVDGGTRDVEGVMEDVAGALRSWEGGERSALDLSAVTGDDGRLSERARRLKLQWNVDGHAIIHSMRPGLGVWIVRFQRVVRRMTWWFLEPILEQIRLFQRNAARTIDGLARSQEATAARVAELEARLAEVERQLAARDSAE